MSDRGVSVALNYVLGLAIATLLLSGLLFAIGNVVDDRHEATTRAELRVIGEQVAADMMTADRLAQTGADTVILKSSNPEAVAGRQYTVEVNATGQAIVLSPTNTDVVVSVPFKNVTDVRPSTVMGGDVTIVLVDDGGPNRSLEVQSS